MLVLDQRLELLAVDVFLQDLKDISIEGVGCLDLAIAARLGLDLEAGFCENLLANVFTGPLYLASMKLLRSPNLRCKKSMILRSRNSLKLVSDS